MAHLPSPQDTPFGPRAPARRGETAVMVWQAGPGVQAIRLEGLRPQGVDPNKLSRRARG